MADHAGTVAGKPVRDGDAALRAYLRRKQRCAAAIQDALGRAQSSKQEEAARQYRELLAKLAEDRFTLAVIGQFKRGKSSLMNAVIGKRLLPTGVLPVTAVVTVVRYGARDGLRIQRMGSIGSWEVPLSELADYVTHEGNPDNRKGIERAILESPAAFLKRDFEFVDTPGVGSTSDASTSATHEFLRHCDAVLFVTAVEAPMNAVEANLLREVKAAGASTIVVVVNKMDLLSEAERESLLSMIRRQTTAVLGDERPVFPVSAKIALDGGVRNDATDPSGLASLQRFLSVLLSDERTEVFLQSLETKVRGLIALETDSGQRTPPSRSSSISTLAGSLSLDSMGVAKPDAGELERFLRGRGCAVCAYMVRKSFDCFAHLQHELATNKRSQRDFAKRGGFCPVHMWSLAAYAGPEGLSQMLPPLAKRLAGLLRVLAREPSDAAGHLQSMNITARECAFCRFQERLEDVFIEGLSHLLRGGSGRQVYGSSQGVCGRHLVLLLQKVGSDEMRTHLLCQTATHCRVLCDDMKAFVLKRTALRRDRLNEDEEDAFRRTLVFVSCDRLVIAPPSAR